MAVTARASLAGLLAAQAVSLTGTRLSMIALPWFVLTTTGSAAYTGLVAFVEMAPYVVAKAACGPILDRSGARRVSVLADTASAVLVLAIPMLHALGLPFGGLLVLVAAVGAARGPGDAAKTALVPRVAAAGGTSLERATGLAGTIDRLGQTIGPFLAGGVVAWLGPMPALLFDGTTFAIAAVVVGWTVRDPGVPAGDRQAERYLVRLRAGFTFIRADPLLRSIVVMTAITNMIDAAVAAVLLPVWAMDTSAGPAAVGLLGTVFGATAVLGSLAATGIAHRLPRRATYSVTFLLCGAPRIAVLAVDAPLWMVAAVWALSGAGAGLIGPVLSTVVFERIPEPLLGRVSALTGTLSYTGIPLGGPAAGIAVAVAGLSPAVLIFAAIFLGATLIPAARPEWKAMNSADRPRIGTP